MPWMMENKSSSLVKGSTYSSPLWLSWMYAITSVPSALLRGPGSWICNYIHLVHLSQPFTLQTHHYVITLTTWNLTLYWALVSPEWWTERSILLWKHWCFCDTGHLVRFSHITRLQSPSSSFRTERGFRKCPWLVDSVLLEHSLWWELPILSPWCLPHCVRVIALLSSQLLSCEVFFLPPSQQPCLLSVASPYLTQVYLSSFVFTFPTNLFKSWVNQ